MGITTNIKVAVSNRLKSAHPSSQHVPLKQETLQSRVNLITHTVAGTITP